MTFEDFTPVLILNEVRTQFWSKSFFDNFLLHNIWHKLRLVKSNLNSFHIFDMWRFYPWMKSKLNFHQNLLDNFFLYDILHKFRRLNSNLKWFHILDFWRLYPFWFWMKVRTQFWSKYFQKVSFVTIVFSDSEAHWHGSVLSFVYILFYIEKSGAFQWKSVHFWWLSKR